MKMKSGGCDEFVGAWMTAINETHEIVAYLGRE
jgi:hypothetical protein